MSHDTADTADTADTDDTDDTAKPGAATAVIANITAVRYPESDLENLPFVYLPFSAAW